MDSFFTITVSFIFLSVLDFECSIFFLALHVPFTELKIPFHWVTVKVKQCLRSFAIVFLNNYADQLFNVQIAVTEKNIEMFVYMYNFALDYTVCMQTY